MRDWGWLLGIDNWDYRRRRNRRRERMGLQVGLASQLSVKNFFFKNCLFVKILNMKVNRLLSKDYKLLENLKRSKKEGEKALKQQKNRERLWPELIAVQDFFTCFKKKNIFSVCVKVEKAKQNAKLTILICPSLKQSADYFVNINSQKSSSSLRNLISLELSASC